MKLSFVLALGFSAITLNGCAVLGGASETLAYEAAPAPTAAPQRLERREAFVPAYGLGRPVALVPCRRGAKITEDCSGANPRHQLGGESSSDEPEASMTEVALVPVSD